MTEKIRKNDIAMMYSMTMTTVAIIALIIIVALIAVEESIIITSIATVASGFVAFALHEMIFYIASIILGIND